MLALVNSALILLLIAQTGSALRCYGCLASPNSECFDGVKESFYEQECVIPQLPNPSERYMSPVPNLLRNVSVPIPHRKGEIVASCIQFTLLEQENNSDTYGRGCAFHAENDDICAFLEELTPIEGCRTCSGDLCNDSPQRRLF